MTILTEVAAELIGRLVGEAQLTISVLAIIAVAALPVDFIRRDPRFRGAVLLLGCLTLLVESVHRGARPRGALPRRR